MESPAHAGGSVMTIKPCCRPRRRAPVSTGAPPSTGTTQQSRSTEGFGCATHEQVTAVVRPPGGRDVDEAWRQRALFAAGGRRKPHGVARFERDIRQPLPIRREPRASRRTLQHTRRSAQRRHLVHVPGRFAGGAEDARACRRRKKPAPRNRATLTSAAPPLRRSAAARAAASRHPVPHPRRTPPCAHPTTAPARTSPRS